MEEINNILEWVFITKCEVPEDVVEILGPNESACVAYRTIRDSAIFTDRRLIIRDVQGITGKKVETYSLPYSSIIMWSTETAGLLFDITAEVELWTKVGNIKIKLQRGVDIAEFDRLISHCVLR